MGEGTRLAVAILVFFLAMLAFFFAFHPGGVEGVSDPATMLQWLMKQWDTTSTPADTGGDTGAATGTTQAPGTTTAGGRGLWLIISQHLELEHRLLSQDMRGILNAKQAAHVRRQVRQKLQDLCELNQLLGVPPEISEITARHVWLRNPRRALDYLRQNS